ncbi:unnamed protein product [Amoebophrya sp. A25]|nr:unnamed protein product [Amoebophrya sp. A25]|eukprot:GSA25T00017983001.1
MSDPSEGSRSPIGLRRPIGSRFSFYPFSTPSTPSSSSSSLFSSESSDATTMQVSTSSSSSPPSSIESIRDVGPLYRSCASQCPPSAMMCESIISECREGAVFDARASTVDAKNPNKGDILVSESERKKAVRDGQRRRKRNQKWAPYYRFLRSLRESCSCVLHPRLCLERCWASMEEQRKKAAVVFKRGLQHKSSRFSILRSRICTLLCFLVSLPVLGSSDETETGTRVKYGNLRGSKRWWTQSPTPSEEAPNGKAGGGAFLEQDDCGKRKFWNAFSFLEGSGSSCGGDKPPLVEKSHPAEENPEEGKVKAKQERLDHLDASSQTPPRQTESETPPTAAGAGDADENDDQAGAGDEDRRENPELHRSKSNGVKRTTDEDTGGQGHEQDTPRKEEEDQEESRTPPSAEQQKPEGQTPTKHDDGDGEREKPDQEQPPNPNTSSESSKPHNQASATNGKPGAPVGAGLQGEVGNTSPAPEASDPHGPPEGEEPRKEDVLKNEISSRDREGSTPPTPGATPKQKLTQSRKAVAPTTPPGSNPSPQGNPPAEIAAAAAPAAEKPSDEAPVTTEDAAPQLADCADKTGRKLLKQLVEVRGKNLIYQNEAQKILSLVLSRSNAMEKPVGGTSDPQPNPNGMEYFYLSTDERSSYEKKLGVNKMPATAMTLYENICATGETNKNNKELIQKQTSEALVVFQDLVKQRAGLQKKLHTAFQSVVDTKLLQSLKSFLVALAQKPLGEDDIQVQERRKTFADNLARQENDRAANTPNGATSSAAENAKQATSIDALIEGTSSTEVAPCGGSYGGATEKYLNNNAITAQTAPVPFLTRILAPVSDPGQELVDSRNRWQKIRPATFGGKYDASTLGAWSKDFGHAMKLADAIKSALKKKKKNAKTGATTDSATEDPWTTWKPVLDTTDKEYLKKVQQRLLDENSLDCKDPANTLWKEKTGLTAIAEEHDEAATHAADGANANKGDAAAAPGSPARDILHLATNGQTPAATEATGGDPALGASTASASSFGGPAAETMQQQTTPPDCGARTDEGKALAELKKLRDGGQIYENEAGDVLSIAIWQMRKHTEKSADQATEDDKTSPYGLSHIYLSKADAKAYHEQLDDNFKEPDDPNGVKTLRGLLCGTRTNKTPAEMKQNRSQRLAIFNAAVETLRELATGRKSLHKKLDKAFNAVGTTTSMDNSRKQTRSPVGFLSALMKRWDWDDREGRLTEAGTFGTKVGERLEELNKARIASEHADEVLPTRVQGDSLGKPILMLMAECPSYKKADGDEPAKKKKVQGDQKILVPSFLTRILAPVSKPGTELKDSRNRNDKKDKMPDASTQAAWKKDFDDAMKLADAIKSALDREKKLAKKSATTEPATKDTWTWEPVLQTTDKEYLEKVRQRFFGEKSFSLDCDDPAHILWKDKTGDGKATAEAPPPQKRRWPRFTHLTLWSRKKSPRLKEEAATSSTSTAVGGEAVGEPEGGGSDGQNQGAPDHVEDEAPPPSSPGTPAPPSQEEAGADQSPSGGKHADLTTASGNDADGFRADSNNQQAQRKGAQSGAGQATEAAAAEAPTPEEEAAGGPKAQEPSAPTPDAAKNPPGECADERGKELLEDLVWVRGRNLISQDEAQKIFSFVLSGSNAMEKPGGGAIDPQPKGMEYFYLSADEWSSYAEELGLNKMPATAMTLYAKICATGETNKNNKELIQKQTSEALVVFDDLVKQRAGLWNELYRPAVTMLTTSQENMIQSPGRSFLSALIRKVKDEDGEGHGDGKENAGAASPRNKIPECRKRAALKGPARDSAVRDDTGLVTFLMRILAPVSELGTELKDSRDSDANNKPDVSTQGAWKKDFDHALKLADATTKSSSDEFWKKMSAGIDPWTQVWEEIMKTDEDKEYLKKVGQRLRVLRQQSLDCHPLPLWKAKTAGDAEVAADEEEIFTFFLLEQDKSENQ